MLSGRVNIPYLLLKLDIPQYVKLDFFFLSIELEHFILVYKIYVDGNLEPLDFLLFCSKKPKKAYS